MERRRDPDAEPATALAGKAAAFLPWYLHWLYPLDLRLLRVFRLCRLLMLVRYSPALQTLGRVVADEYRALLGGLLVILILLLFASSGMYLTERHMQPDKVGSIPQAAWWALATMVMSCR
jgi:voltage-gated potassium channel